MITETIRRVNGYSHDGYTYYPVIIVGAGASGIAMACQLKQQLGFDQFRIFDRQAGIGGTWWINRYPGIACDVPAVFYSFPFAQNPNWTSFYPPGNEIVRYYHEVCEQYKITDKIELNTDVGSCKWLDDEKLWEVTIRRMVAGMGNLSAKERQKIADEKGEHAVYSETEIVKSKVVVSCVGGLGKMFHSARWDESVDFTDTNVVVVGTGCSSAQLVPRLPNAPYNAKKNSAKLLKYVPGLKEMLRFTLYEQKTLENMKRHVPKKCWDIMTPDYGVGCKRRIFDKRWLKSLDDPNIKLTTQPLSRATENGVVLGRGVTYPRNANPEDYPEKEIPADVIILANGFDTTRWLHPLKVAGRNGNDLVELMEDLGGPQAYQGTAMPGFPNFFMIFGPNNATGHSSVVMASENTVNFLLKFISLILNNHATTVEIEASAEKAYTADMQSALKNTIWHSGCSSWYYAKDGWNSTVYPYSQIDFWRRCTFPTWSHWNIEYTSKGLVKIRRTRVLRVLAVLVAVVGAWRVRQMGLRVGDIRAMIGRMVRRLVDGNLARLVQSLSAARSAGDLLITNKGVYAR
ncbi:FAD/NAD(P)-binding domain-containing protein [Plenodomus tracheiphilus IPT5]|uniref:FAD/NAD(P)-binding domain-containing protein n=1 Tax=Plenodomus tracheiphilus IPT5 TaxID=1408161 RepID=A0A6A7BL37_9PLEO|nr:FAD/NAD(P)-binding domain-containing protein [Plenodomus tracheiphilus IPT5]